MIFPFLAGLFGGLGAAGAAAAPVAAGAGTAAGIGAGLGAAGAAGGAGALGTGLTAAQLAPVLASATGAGGAVGGLASGIAPGALAASAPGAAVTTAAELGTLAGSSVPAAAAATPTALPAAAGPLAGGAGTEAAKIAARLPGMIPPSPVPTPLASTAVPTQALTEGAGFAGTPVPEIFGPSAGMTPPVPSPAQMFGTGPGGAPAPMTAPTGPAANLQIIEPAFVEPGMGPLQQAAMDVTRSTQFPAGPLPTAPSGPGVMPPSRMDVAFSPAGGFPEPGLMPGPTAPMPADATVTMAPPDPIDVAAAPPGPMSPVDIPGSATQPPPQAVGAAPEPLADVPSVSGPTEETLTFADSGAGIEPPAPFEAPPADAPADDRGIFGGYGKFIIPAAAAASAFLPSTGGGKPEDDDDEGPGEAEAAEYDVAFPGADYVPGVDPEFRYFTPRFANGGQVLSPELLGMMIAAAPQSGAPGPEMTSGRMMPTAPAPAGSEMTSGRMPGYAEGGMINVPFSVDVGEPSVELGGMVPPSPGGIGGALGQQTPAAPTTMPNTMMPPQAFQEGGMVDDPRMNVMMEAADALRGNHPNPQEAIMRFVEMFGEAALQDLQANVANEPRMVQGPGGPKDDMIPAVINDVQEARLSDGEFVMPADAVMAAGNGDATLGAQQLQMLSEQLRGQPPTGQLNVDRVAS